MSSVPVIEIFFTLFTTLSFSLAIPLFNNLIGRNHIYSNPFLLIGGLYPPLIFSRNCLVMILVPLSSIIIFHTFRRIYDITVFVQDRLKQAVERGLEDAKFEKYLLPFKYFKASHFGKNMGKLKFFMNIPLVILNKIQKVLIDTQTAKKFTTNCRFCSLSIG